MSWSDRSPRDRFNTPRLERDPDVERRDRLREMERLRAINQSPWSIGVAHWNQRDLYTRNSRIDEEGYGRGPELHPERGSYAYPRQLRRPREEDRAPREAAGGPTLHQRQAWPWLNYTSPSEDPYFAHLAHPRDQDRDVRGGGLWQKLKGGVSELLHGAPPRNAVRPDARILEDVNDALTFRGDLDATDIDVEVADGEVTLRGTVPDRRSKRIAEETAEGVRGVHDVHNRLSLRKDDPTDANVAFVLPLAALGRGA